MEEFPAATRRVVAELSRRGIDIQIIESKTSTRTAAEAAASLGTTVGQIVKSLVFLVDGQPVLALVSGSNRLDEGKLARAIGGREVSRANAEQVREITGFAIGGVPPVTIGTNPPVVCDADLLQYPVVYAAAGTPNHNFAIDPRRLVEIAGARVIDLKAAPSS
jgi:prolyl-tRNA editing enzyme YbaK/EbsC (Cys-tRNA(Pro) deacylase)